METPRMRALCGTACAVKMKESEQVEGGSWLQGNLSESPEGL